VQQRILWVSVCALAVLGGFLLVTQAMWMLGIGYGSSASWLPYVTGTAGALVGGASAGFAVAPARRYDGALGALGAVAVLLGVGLFYPRGFTWTPLNLSSTPALTVPLAAALMAAAGFAGTRWMRPSDGPAGAVGAGMLTSFTMVLLVCRIVVVRFGLTHEGEVTLVMMGATLVGANLVQELVRTPRVAAITIGAAAFLAWQLLFGITKAHLKVGENVLMLAVPVLGAAIGAHMALQRMQQAALRKP
jgi:hypothetical protein